MDILYICIYTFTAEILYVYHHIVLLYALNSLKNNINSNEIINLLFIGEISNIFNYIVYHLIKKNINKNIIFKFRIIQVLWFLYFRGYILTYYIIKYYEIANSKILFNLLFSIYILGLVWGYHQLKYIIKIIYDSIYFY